MSRTYRRKKGDLTELTYNLLGYEYITVDIPYGYESKYWTYIQIDKNSEEGKNIVIKFHMDGSRSYWKGPMWFHREYSQVPYRQRARQELIKFMRNHDYEVIIENKPKSRYWD